MIRWKWFWGWSTDFQNRRSRRFRGNEKVSSAQPRCDDVVYNIMSSPDVIMSYVQRRWWRVPCQVYAYQLAHKDIPELIKLDTVSFYCVPLEMFANRVIRCWRVECTPRGSEWIRYPVRIRIRYPVSGQDPDPIVWTDSSRFWHDGQSIHGNLLWRDLNNFGINRAYNSIILYLYHLTSPRRLTRLSMHTCITWL